MIWIEFGDKRSNKNKKNKNHIIKKNKTKSRYLVFRLKNQVYIVIVISG